MASKCSAFDLRPSDNDGNIVEKKEMVPNRILSYISIGCSIGEESVEEAQTAKADLRSMMCARKNNVLNGLRGWSGLSALRPVELVRSDCGQG